MKIFVKPIIGKLIVLDVDPNVTIETLKQNIEYKSGIPTNQQRLIFEGIPLLEGILRTYNLASETLSLPPNTPDASKPNGSSASFNIQPDSTIDLVMCLG